MFLGQLPDEEDHEPDDGHDGQGDDGAGIEPVEILPLVEHDLHGTDP